MVGIHAFVQLYEYSCSSSTLRLPVAGAPFHVNAANAARWQLNAAQPSVKAVHSGEGRSLKTYSEEYAF